MLKQHSNKNTHSRSGRIVISVKSSTYSSWRISLMVLSSEIMSLATMLKPNSLIELWTVSLYSGPRTKGLAPSPGPPGTPGGSGSLGSKFPRIPFFRTGLVWPCLWGLNVTYCCWITCFWFCCWSG